MSKAIDTTLASAEFDRMYRAPITPWGDVRIPQELRELIATCQPRTSLELGCGIGRFSSFMAKQGIEATGVDFSAVAIEKARTRTAHDEKQPTFLIGDVTNLNMLHEPFDVSFDIGCFQCLDEEGHPKYAAEVYRLLKPGGRHVIWAFYSTPIGVRLSPEYITQVFGGHFRLAKSTFSLRRLIPARWYWLVREG